jgi:hypothetical protein
MGQGQPPAAPGDRLIAQATTIKDRHLEELFALPGVVGAGVGTSPKHPGKAVIQVYVGRRLKAKERRLFPKVLEGVPVEVQITGPIRAFPERRAGRPHTTPPPK